MQPEFHLMDVMHREDFWARLQASPSRFLGLDYDGTLAPFHENRLKAHPLAGVVDLVRAIGERPKTTLTIISGRPAAEVLALLGAVPVTIIGGHGYETLHPDGSLIVTSPLPDQLDGLEQAGAEADRLGLSAHVEIKVASIAFHSRGMAPEKAAELEGRIHQTWSDLAAPHGLECRRFNGGIEIRASGLDKGAALRSLLDRQPERTFAVYIGDDDTDEDAFRVIRGVGFGIRVGEPGGPTAATGLLRDGTAVRDFLEAWLVRTGYVP